ncbi:MAG: zinc-ribbon domain-containing protein [Planctomycetota bacterium]
MPPYRHGMPDGNLSCPECAMPIELGMPACPDCGERLYVEHRGDVPRDATAVNSPSDLAAG